jgi:divalent metal cation (Fe/Co/Zn/Cd) transporter
MDGVESQIHELFPNADVVVHASPREPATSDVVEKIRFIAHRGNFQVHDVTAYKVEGRVNVNLDLEVDPSLSLEAAHGQATRLEGELKRELPGVNEVTVHIEPRPKGVEAGDQRSVDAQMERKLMAIARETPGVVGCPSLQAHHVAGNVVVRMTCTVEPGLSVGRVHDLTEELKLKFRKAFPHISRVSIHAEPKQET